MFLPGWLDLGVVLVVTMVMVMVTRSAFFDQSSTVVVKLCPVYGPPFPRDPGTCCCFVCGGPRNAEKTQGKRITPPPVVIEPRFDPQPIMSVDPTYTRGYMYTVDRSRGVASKDFLV